MDDEDEIDILSDFNLENLLCKKDGRLSFYDGVQNLDISCDYSNVSSHWLLDSNTQSVWDDKQNESRGQFLQGDSAPDSSGWTDKEKYLLDKGLELFGRSWARLAQYIGSKNASQVKYYTKNVLDSNVPVVNDFFSTWSDADNPTSLLQSELIDDMEIPASMEEVISAVSTASPTISVPVSKSKLPVTRKRRISSSPCAIIQRSKQQRTKGYSKRKINFIPDKQETKVSERIVNTINNEEVVILGRSEDEDSEIDVTDDEPSQKGSIEELPLLSSPFHLNEPQAIPTTSSASSFPSFSSKAILPNLENNLQIKVEIETEVPLQLEPLEQIYHLPDPIEEVEIDMDAISQEEENLFPEFFHKGTSMVLRYLKIRNHIIDSWKLDKPKYIAKTRARRCLKNCGDVNLISRIHLYLEKKGVINFGCPRCRYRTEPKIDVRRKLILGNSRSSSSYRIIQTRKNKARIPGSLLNCGGITMAHGDDGQVIQIIKEPLYPKPRKLDVFSRRAPLPIQV